MSDATDMEEISYEDRLKSIAIHPATKSWIDENVFALMLGFDSLKDLNKFVKTVKTRGGSGKYAGAIDVEDCSKDNPLHLHLAVHGSKKKKYYRLGMKRRDREKPDTFSIGTQINMLQYVTGDPENQCKAMNVLQDEKKRRRASWKKFFSGKGSNSYELLDLPDIIHHFADQWDEELEEGRATIEPNQLSLIKNEIMDILYYSNVLTAEECGEESYSIIRTDGKRKRKRGDDDNEYSSDEDEGNDDGEEDEGNDDSIEMDGRKSVLECLPRSSTLKRKRTDKDEASLLSPSEDEDEEVPLATRNGTYQESMADLDLLTTASESQRVTRSIRDSQDNLASIESDEDEPLSAEQDEMWSKLGLGKYKEVWNVSDEARREVASWEMAILDAYNVTRGDNVYNLILDGKHTNAKIKSLGGIERSPAQLQLLVKQKSLLSRKKRDFDELRKHNNKTQFLHIPDRLLLLQYLETARKASEALRDGKELIGREMRTTKDSWNNQPELTYEAAACIRQILYGHNVSLNKFNGILNSFAVLLLGRPLEEDEFASTSTIRNWLKRLAVLDRHYRSVEDKALFCAKSEHGFHIVWGMAADCTTHGSNKDGKHHVAIRSRGTANDTATDNDGDGEDDEDEQRKRKFMVDASFELLTTARAVSEDSKGNATLNFQSITENVDPEVIPYLAGFAFDNAALSEGFETMELLMEWLRKNKPEMTKFWGVERRPIIINDFFHNCNIFITTASHIMSGLTTKNLREFHPRRVLQHFHDINIRLKPLSDYVALKLLGEERYKQLDRRTTREREQRWKVNGEFALRILTGFEEEFRVNGKCFWVAWAEEMMLHLDVSDYKYDVLKEISQHLLNEGVVASLTFEAELVDNYFDITHRYHAYGGENCERPGFRLMDLPNLIIDFICPFWRGAKDDPTSRFPRTVGAIEAMNDVDKKSMKMEQLNAAIDGVLEKMAKHCERWMKFPLAALLLPHPVHGPPLLRAALRCLADTDFDIHQIRYEDDPRMVRDDTEFGEYLYEDGGDMPEDMLAWYNLYKDEAEDVAHWFQQLGLARACVREELKMLSREGDPANEEEESDNEEATLRSPESSTPLWEFYEKYPTLYDALQAAFARLPSNTRITEMAHSFVRQIYNSQIPVERLTDMLKFIMEKEYHWRQERREMTKHNHQKKRRRTGSREHMKTKGQQAKVSEQLYDDLPIKYSKMEIQRTVPDNVQNDMKLRTLAADGWRKSEKERNELLVEKFKQKCEKKQARGTAIPHDAATLRREANERETEHDKNWRNLAYRQRAELMNQFLLKGYWKGIRAREEIHLKGLEFVNKYKYEMKMVLPYFWKDAVEKATKTAIEKSDAKDEINLGKHLDEIRQIAAGKKENTINDKDLTDMSELEIMEEFVHIDKSPNKAIIQKEIAQKRAKVNAVFDLFGTTISSLARYKNEPLYDMNENDDLVMSSNSIPDPSELVNDDGGFTFAYGEDDDDDDQAALEE